VLVDKSSIDIQSSDCVFDERARGAVNQGDQQPLFLQ
jgi:hypothetical protein